MDLSGITGSAYTEYAQSELNNAYQNKIKSTLENITSSGKSTSNTEEVDEELMDACKQFEAYFLEQVFKEMEKSVSTMREANGSKDNSLVSYFKSQAIADIATTSTETNSNGLAQMLYENMSRNYGVNIKSAEETAGDTAAETADNSHDVSEKV